MDRPQSVSKAQFSYHVTMGLSVLLKGTDGAYAESARVQPSQITSLLHDPLFNGYNSAILEIAGSLKKLATWLEGCPCHMPLLSACGRKSRKHIKTLLSSKSACPASGCRAPEIACGAIADITNQLAAASVKKVLSVLLPSATQICKDILSREIQSAKAYVELGLRVKFDCSIVFHGLWLA